MSQLKRGNELSKKLQSEVLAMYVHRFTRDHVPEWVIQAERQGEFYPLQFDSDSDWLANTRFFVNSDGTLNKRFHHCESNPTWPNNPELRR